MKRFILFSIIFLLINISIVSANPIAITYFNEIQFRESGWIIELHSDYPIYEQLDSVFITSKNDTAFIKPFFLTDTIYYVLTEDSLTSNLQIDPANDTLCFYLRQNTYGYADDRLILGNIPFKSSQSLSRGSSDFWYIDNSPTIGMENDSEGGKGTIIFLFTDIYQNPIPNVNIFLGYIEYVNGLYDSVIVQSDSNGLYTYTGWATYRRFQDFFKDGYLSKDSILLIYPDSIQTVVILMEAVEHGIANPGHQLASRYYLSPAYPNPFNSSTNFHYTLPEDGFVILSVFSMTGSLVAELFKGYRYAGNYRVNWNADDISSGIYLINLTTRNRSIQRKCILLK